MQIKTNNHLQHKNNPKYVIKWRHIIQFFSMEGKFTIKYSCQGLTIIIDFKMIYLKWENWLWKGKEVGREGERRKNPSHPPANIKKKKKKKKFGRFHFHFRLFHLNYFSFSLSLFQFPSIKIAVDFKNFSWIAFFFFFLFKKIKFL